MRSITRLLFVLSVLSFAPVVTAQAPAAEDGAPTITLAKLVAVRNLRCDALGRGKRARLRADIHRAEVGSTLGPNKINVESKVTQAEAEAGAAFEEAGSLKRRLGGMLDRYVADSRLQWYQTVDEAERVRLEDLIAGANEIVDEPCE
jgi:hypothetical protein